jgi:hypothetical protein
MNKIKIPIKTKLACWLIIIFGGVLIYTWISNYSFSEVFDMVKYFSTYSTFPMVFFVSYLLILVFPLFSIILILTKKRWAWWLVTVTSLLLLTFFIIYVYSLDIIYKLFLAGLAPETVLTAIFAILIPFLLLLIDAKNFFKNTKLVF